MKKILALVLVLLSLVPISLAESTFDLSAMSYDELVALKEQIDLAIWNSNEWQEVEVPQGLWEVGRDIPVGYWTIKPNPKAYVTITIGDSLDDGNTAVDIWASDYYVNERIIGHDSFMYSADTSKELLSIDLKTGMYVEIDGGSVIFTPYSGKPSLGFK